MQLPEILVLPHRVQREASGAGSHRNSSSSVSAFLSTLVPCIALAAVLVSAFLLLRNKQRRLYAPRTFHDSLAEDEKTPAADPSLFGWVKNFRAISDEYILSHHSLDAYLYVRFFKMLVFMSFMGCLITWPILFPVNATGGGGQAGLDILSFSNVNNPSRYFAHALVGWVFFGFVLFLIWREMLYLVKVRQAYLLSTWNASRISQRTVLFTNVPNEFLSHERLQSTFSRVSQVWLVSDTSDLEDDIDGISDTVLKLEKCEIKFVQNVNKAYQKNGQQKSTGNAHVSLDGFLQTKMRPTHRSKPLVGKKVDTIDYCRDHLMELLPKAQSAKRTHLKGEAKLINAVFIEFKTLGAAQAAYALTISDKPGTFVARQFGVLPNEIIWKNLKMNSWNRSARHAVATAFIAALILFWSIPVTLVGIISNVNYLTENVPFLRWIDSIPDVILGVITGLLPTILLAALMALVPIICRLVAKLAGAITLSEVEQTTQKWYFAFQLIQVFLITTFSSGATAVASQIVSDPAQAVPLLAKNLPKASNFYISYFVLYGVANAAKYLFNVTGLLGIFVLSKLAGTPRKKYEKYVQLTSPSWGSDYPRWTNLGVIAIAYSVISPLVLGFATVGMGLIYLAYRYNMLYVHNTQIDTKGACYARALEQLMVGIYLSELCVLGLFGIGIGDSVSAVGPVVLQIVLIVVTVGFHLAMRGKLRPLVEVLPLNLLNEAKRDEYSKVERADIDNGLHPGYDSPLSQLVDVKDEEEQNDGAVNPQGLVSSVSARRSDQNHTYAAANGLGEGNQHPKQSLFQRVFMPHKQSAANISASLAPCLRRPVKPYTSDEAREAYINPALVQEAPVIWLARDPLGVSQKEVAELRDTVGRYGVEATDEGARVDKKNKVEWVDGSVRTAPLWDGRVVY